jgi:maltoporin
VLVTPALSGDLFHYDGDWGDDLALRNLYVQADRFAAGAPVAVWAGSRMYRGDDIYLLDFWPLDNLNTYGGGVRIYPGRTEINLHAGVNRLANSWQVQEVLVATPASVSGEEVLVLDRQRTVGTLRVGHEIPAGDVTFRARLYGEVHALPEGERWVDDAWDALDTETLPSDRGSLVGAQLSLWGWAPQSFAHLWFRRATGLAAVGELAVPDSGLALDLRVAGTRSTQVAFAANTDTGRLGVMAGGYLAYDVDADGAEMDFDDRWELVGVIRPQVYLGDHVALGAEVSHQYVRPNGLNPRTDTFDRPDVTKLSLLPAVQTEPGGFSRPRIHLVYTATLLDDEARRFFSPYDARLSDGVQHFVGAGAEWWINSQRSVTPF